MAERKQMVLRGAEESALRLERQHAVLAAIGDPDVTPVALRLALIRTVELLSADAGSVFLFDEHEGLRGGYGIWDWMRTSFLARLEDWPNVRDAIVEQRPRVLTRALAREVEVDWFGGHGIDVSLVVPLIGDAGPAGVLFIDYFDDACALSAADEAFLAELSRGWALAVERGPRSVSRPAIAPSELSAENLPIAQLMSRAPVMIDSRIPVHVALRLAQAAGVHHLVAVHEGRLAGVVSQAELEAARPSASVDELQAAVPQHVTADTNAGNAARLVLEHGIGCLPVTDGEGHVLGVVTRRDLRAAGVLHGERGVDVCAACGSSHQLPPLVDRDLPVFCDACLGRRASTHTIDVLYRTLGGAD